MGTKLLASLNGEDFGLGSAAPLSFPGMLGIVGTETVGEVPTAGRNMVPEVVAVVGISGMLRRESGSGWTDGGAITRGPGWQMDSSISALGPTKEKSWL